MLYQVLLGQEKGPRFGSFVAVYGVQNTVDMIDGALARTCIARACVPGAAQHANRCAADPGTAEQLCSVGGPASAAHRGTLHRVRDTDR